MSTYKRWFKACLLYTSDAADERSSVDLGGRRIIKKKKNHKKIIKCINILSIILNSAASTSVKCYVSHCRSDETVHTETEDTRKIAEGDTEMTV